MNNVERCLRKPYCLSKNKLWCSRYLKIPELMCSWTLLIVDTMTIGCDVGCLRFVDWVELVYFSIHQVKFQRHERAQMLYLSVRRVLHTRFCHENILYRMQSLFFSLVSLTILFYLFCSSRSASLVGGVDFRRKFLWASMLHMLVKLQSLVNDGLQLDIDIM